MRCTLAVVSLCAVFCQAAQAREWTDVSGAYHFAGELVRVQDDQVWLLGDNGRLRACQWDYLSSIDQQYVREITALRLSHSGAAAEQPASTSPLRSVSQNRGQVGAERVVFASLSTANQPPPPPGKRIFSGFRSTFQLNGATGTGSYWLHNVEGCDRHYLASLTYHGRLGAYLVYTSVGKEGGVYGWYFYDAEVCGCGGNPVYMIGAAGKPIRYEHDYREIPH